MRVSLGADAAQVNVDEVILGLWRFANALGLLTDVIGERTAAAGVTIDGLLVKDAGIPEAAVTAHEIALSILETQIPDGSIFPRLANTEIITGLWVFSHASGILLDTIGERTLLNGVTIDGCHLVDGRVDNRNYALASNAAFITSVVGDGDIRYLIRASGLTEWGDGTNPVDTNLFRAAADELKTDDAFTVGAALTAEKELIVGVNVITLTADVENVDTTGVTSQRLTGDANWAVGGWAGGVDGRLIFVFNADTAETFAMKHESAGSTAANRMILPGATAMSLGVREGVWFMYDGVSSRWTPIKHEI